MEKVFNLKIDTKNKNISTVTGFKQFDNNSILNIILLQNNLALDLSNYAIRINFLREDNKVLLYMANIVNSKEGKLSIKVSPEVLEKVGTVKADISVFDSNLLKITSATFNMKVDKAIYTNDTYFSEKDLDMMQQEYIREKERQSNENTRKTNENTRIQSETKRNSNENTRISNEEARKKNENTRVSEWNNVKKDATNIKNTLDTTISTANKAKDNLQSTIDKADTATYASKGDIKTLTTQYEDLTNKTEDLEKKTDYYIFKKEWSIKKSIIHYRFRSWKNDSTIAIMSNIGNLDFGNLDCTFDFTLYVHFRDGTSCKIDASAKRLPPNFKNTVTVFYKIDNSKGFLDIYIKINSNYVGLKTETQEFSNAYESTTIRGEEVDNIPKDVIQVEFGGASI